MIRLLICDDHAIVRKGLRQLFSLVDDIEVVGEANNGGDVLDTLRKMPVDILLMDMTMPGISGEDLIARIRAHHPTQAILVLSMHDEAQVAQRALRAGAAGYLTKDSEPEVLLAAIRRVVQGGNFIDPGIAEQLVFQASGQQAAPCHGALSSREYQVLCLLARGRSVNDIAEELSISNKTVSTHKARLMEKMGFASNAALIRYAVTHGLVE
ncbi:response regulator transcription factor [Pelomonas sp. P7]|uniref:Response regulator transcription factor n=1 Tax=Pelomonas caseinilytica TaxID=2906763 RepID=A0ABS8XDE5_9BURK|nr:response regulator transcription factor [Pelomonas sp. P7]MCE4538937.1 response regulator transcription factor [Pelomonas sp. P7]